MAQVILANPTAGLLAGDRHVVEVSAATGARAQVTTQAATKVFSMHGGCAEQRLRLSTEHGGWLEYVSHAVIPFRSASLQQNVEITVAATATAIYADILSLGRVESSERLAFRSIALDLRVQRPNGPELYIESYRLSPSNGSLDAPGILGSGKAAAVGTLLVVTDELRPETLCEVLRDQAGNKAMSAALAPLPGGGGVVGKVIAASAFEAESMLLNAIRCLADTARRSS
jgi:urease accessory protein